MESQQFIPANSTTLFGSESKYKYFQTHIEILKWCISKSTYNNYNYEQPIVLFVVLLPETHSPLLWKLSSGKSYSSLHSGWSLAWKHIHGVITDPCGDWR